MYDLILVRYGEMTLKKKNYRHFLQKINENIKNRLKHYARLQFSNTDYRLYIYLNGEDYCSIVGELDMIFGLSSYSLCVKCQPDYDEIAEKAIALIINEKKHNRCSFKVETKRSDKSYPATSPEITKEVAGRILPNIPGLFVDVHHPDLILHIELRREGTYIYIKTIKGLGGLPGGISGDGLLMLSGGIDSPVAGFLSLKKGIDLIALHFASPPYTSDRALQKVVDLLQELTKYTSDGTIKMLICPFTKIQEAIIKYTDQIYNITIMRRLMFRIADMICRKYHLNIIVTGESIGQVASQTIESMKVINEVTNLPIIRPLATYDKQEIIAVARKIGTYDISIRPYEDCCTIFVPEHPVIKPQQKRVEFQEKKCDFKNLIDESIENIKILNLNKFKKYSIFEELKISGNFEI